MDRFSPARAQANPDQIFLFGDNLADTGTLGQAVIRGEPNAHGIPTKKAPRTDDAAFFSDAELTENMEYLDIAFANIPEGKTIVLPHDGLGTGLAELESRAPETFAYLQNKLGELMRNASEVSGSSPQYTMEEPDSPPISRTPEGFPPIGSPSDLVNLSTERLKELTQHHKLGDMYTITDEDRAAAETAMGRIFGFNRNQINEAAGRSRATGQPVDVDALGEQGRIEGERRDIMRQLSRLQRAREDDVLESVPRPSTEVLGTFQERRNKPPLRNPLAYVKQYAKDLEDSIDLGGNKAEENGVGATEHYQPHIDRLGEARHALITYNQARGSEGTELPFAQTNVIFKAIDYLKSLTDMERDFQGQRRISSNPQILAEFLHSIDIFEKIYYPEGADVPTIWRELGDKIMAKESFTHEDVLNVADFLQRSRITAAKDVTLSLRGIGLDDIWKETILDHETFYGEQSPSNPRNYVGRKEHARDILIGNKEKGIPGIIEESGGVMPVQGTELFVKMMRAAETNPTAFRDFNLAIGAPTSNRTPGAGYTSSPDIRDMLRALSPEAIRIWHSRFIREPEKYMNDEAQLQLISDVIEEMKRKVRQIPGKSMQEPIDKKIKTFKTYNLLEIPEEEETAIQPMPDDFEGTREEWGRSEHERILGAVIAGQEEDEAIEDADANVLGERGYGLVDTGTSVDEDDNLPELPGEGATASDWERYDKELEAAKILTAAPTVRTEWDVRDNVADAPEGEGGYVGHTLPDFKNALENIADTLYNLTYTIKVPVIDKETGRQALTQRGNPRTRSVERRAVGDVYLAGDLAKVYHGIEDSSFGPGTPIEIKVRIPSQADNDETNSHQIATEIVNNTISRLALPPGVFHDLDITPHVGEVGISNDD